MNLPINLTTELLELRNTLHNINQVGFSFSLLNKSYPLEGITESEALTLIDAYRNLIDNVKKLINE